jgi:SAM-dependent methyltransferase
VYADSYAPPDELYVDGYLLERTDYGIDPMTPLFQSYLRHCADIRLRRIERSTGVGRLLDVGCGTGEVLLAARDRGWECHGAEPVGDSAAFAREERGLDVRATLLQDSGFPERHFDVVSAFHVLEHMTDGIGFLELLARWVRPGGHVVVEVPNWRSVHRKGAPGEWPHLRPHEHLAYHTAKTLQGTLAAAGLETVRVTTPGFVWSGQPASTQRRDLGLTRVPGAGILLGRPGALRNRVAVSALQSLYDRARVGMVILAIARVP